jgi:tRNA(Ile)-lysidine synthase
VLAERANRVGHVRIALENAASALLAVCCTVHPAGYARLDQSIVAAAPEDVSFRALARILMCVGGREYAPRREKLERLHAVVVGGKLGKARTLGGCRILAERYRILVCREMRGMPEPIAAVPGTRVVWDGRFVIRFAATGKGAPRPRHPAHLTRLGHPAHLTRLGHPAHLTRLGRDGWAEVAADRPDLKAGPVPAAARLALPALRDEWGVFTVPHLYYTRTGGPGPGVGFGHIAFCPPNSISGVGFRLA